MPENLGLVIIPIGVNPEEHEVATALRFSNLGIDVRFRMIDHTAGAKNPDVVMHGEVWEFKSPKGASEKNTISDQFKRANKQAQNVVIDLARCGLDDEIAVSQIKWRFAGQGKITKMTIIDHRGNIVHLSK